MSIVRVLAIPDGAKCDAEGYKVGSNWHLASFGQDHEGTDFHLTTDGMHASELADMPWLEPGDLAELVARETNERWERYIEMRRCR